MNQNEIIEELVADILKLCKPVKIFLISSKTNTIGELISLKLCVIVENTCSTTELETDIYIHIDCPVPYDVLVYNLEEWNWIKEEEGSFASKINTTGVVIYE